MITEVRGKNGFVVTDAIDRYASDKLEKVDHYFNQPLKAYVLCKSYKDHQKVEVTIPTKYFTMRAEVADEDLYAAIDLAIDKLERQIRKNKTKMQRSIRKKEGVAELFSEDVDLDALEKELVETPFRVKKIPLESMTSAEAITALEMIDHDFYLFKDSETSQISIAYLRHDGNYGIIETE